MEIIKSRVVLEDLSYIGRNFDEKGTLEDSTILVTGCAGFLGFYLLQYLSRFAEELKIKRVIGLDNFSLGSPKWIAELKEAQKDKLHLHSFDITSGDISSIERSEEADYIVHMASIASPVMYRKHPVETIDANVWGLRKLIDYYRDKNIKGFLFFSSSEIYGDPSTGNIPTPENYRGNVSCIGPRACYDEAKRFGETLCYVYSSQHCLPIAIVRPFNNYGPGMKLDDGRVPADFAHAVFNNADIIMLSDGSPRRTFCYVADAVVGYLKALVHGRFDYFNIGIDKPEISVKKLAEIFAENGKKIMGYTGSIRHGVSRDKDYLTHNPARRCPVIDKARTVLGYRPSIEVVEGVGRFLRFIADSRGVL